MMNSRKLFRCDATLVVLLLGLIFYVMLRDEHFHYFILGFPILLWVLFQLFFCAAILPAISVVAILLGIHQMMNAFVSQQPPSKRIGYVFVALFSVGIGAGGIYYWAFRLIGPMAAGSN